MCLSHSETVFFFVKIKKENRDGVKEKDRERERGDGAYLLRS